MTKQAILTTENISLSFGGLKAVNDVSIQINPGEILAIIGPNGAGKTSLFNIITGIYKSTSGCIYIGQNKLQDTLDNLFWLKTLLFGFLISFSTVFLIYIPKLWEQLINQKYIWGQSFDWFNFFKSFIPTLLEVGGYNFILLQVCVFIISVFALWSIKKEFCLTPSICSKKGLARTFQNIRLFKGLTVLDNVVLGLKESTDVFLVESLFLPRTEKHHTNKLVNQAIQLLDKVGLTELKDRFADELSYGNKRRLEIARALASDPKILLLDEPAAGLNPAEGEQLAELIESIKNDGISVVLIEHHMKVVMNISDRIIVLHQGSLLASGTPEQIRNNPAVISAYLGDSANDMEAH
jgi:branched-chain amino acid transport system ATP-binding protein